MNYSDHELSGTRTEEGSRIEAGVRLLPIIGAALFSAISHLGHAYRLTPAQVKVLLQLGTHRQMTVGEIAGGLACSMPAASELVDRLVDAGHLVRSSDPTDRRRVLIAATPESERIGAHLHELREAQIRFALEQLPLDERPFFITSLEALVAGLKHTAGDPEPGCQAAPVAGASPAARADARPALVGAESGAESAKQEKLHDPALALFSRGND